MFLALDGFFSRRVQCIIDVDFVQISFFGSALIRRRYSLLYSLNWGSLGDSLERPNHMRIVFVNEPTSGYEWVINTLPVEKLPVQRLR